MLTCVTCSSHAIAAPTTHPLPACRVAKRAAPAAPAAPLSPSGAEAASSPAAGQSTSAAGGLLVVSTTATQSESYEESALLAGRGWALVSEPARNPFMSLEVQQSGTMGELRSMPAPGNVVDIVLKGSSC
jgi:hypothetical protein